jgi:hypothetical protein
MSAPSQHTRRLLILLVAIVALLAVASPAPTARATSSPTWAAWGITVDFPGKQLQVIYTAYVGTNDTPPVVTAWSEEDITASCTIQGPPFAFDGDYAIFNGQTYIECTLPAWRDKIKALAPGLPAAHKNVVTGDPGFGPLWAAADVKLDAVTSANPVLDAQELGMVFSLPSTWQPNNSTLARTRLTLSSGAYLSPSWLADMNAGNRMLIGEDGPAIVAVDGEFGWLNFLTIPAWKSYFTNQVTGMTLGSWVEAPGSSWKQTPVPSYQLKTTSGTVYIGYSPSSGAHFFGKIRSIRFDPGAKGV